MDSKADSTYVDGLYDTLQRRCGDPLASDLYRIIEEHEYDSESLVMDVLNTQSDDECNISMMINDKDTFCAIHEHMYEQQCMYYLMYDHLGADYIMQ